MRISHKEKQCIFTQPRLEESNNCPKTQAQVSRAGGDLFQETPLTKMPGMLSQAKTQAEIGQNTALPCLLPCCRATLSSCSHIAMSLLPTLGQALQLLPLVHTSQNIAPSTCCPPRLLLQLSSTSSHCPNLKFFCAAPNSFDVCQVPSYSSH